jgi:DNA-directed RNA polymerase specialized sigma24 family protein
MDELIGKAKAGDVEAFEAVVRQTARPLRAMLAWHVSDPGAVDDLLQET